MTSDYQYMPRSRPVPGVEYPLTVAYCGECTMPIEYCEFSSAPDKCRSWMEKNLPEEFERLTACDGAPPAEAPAKGRQVRGGKGSAPRKPAKQKITVFKTSRGKKKFTTSVVGLSTFEFRDNSVGIRRTVPKKIQMLQSYPAGVRLFQLYLGVQYPHWIQIDCEHCQLYLEPLGLDDEGTQFRLFRPDEQCVRIVGRSS
ncbi:hypothetical protein T265_05507 [Opisthorchis viverrini]|uniref:DENR N-terminal domain-containing protein n=1 Tax=Opisthorchis viverrini TaxID=6198 RepID=A0A074ZJF6_OPIVI|nr:hypothetical protein T265_05507 [Opisthorchis viverrini]KER27478.1 hypothetical protein T265_05507 [Opisthorchis viverrini]